MCTGVMARSSGTEKASRSRGRTPYRGMPRMLDSARRCLPEWLLTVFASADATYAVASTSPKQATARMQREPHVQSVPGSDPRPSLTSARLREALTTSVDCVVESAHDGLPVCVDMIPDDVEMITDGVAMTPGGLWKGGRGPTAGAARRACRTCPTRRNVRTTPTRRLRHSRRIGDRRRHEDSAKSG